MRGIKGDRSKKPSKREALSTTIDCPWDTIRMVPTPSVAGHQTSLDSQSNKEHAIFQRPELVPEEIRGFVEKPAFSDPTAAPLFQKQNPQVPGMMSPKQPVSRDVAPRCVFRTKSSHCVGSNPAILDRPKA